MKCHESNYGDSPEILVLSWLVYTPSYERL